MAPPNLLLIISDQFRASSVGCLGQDPTHTPAVDRLAREGRLLTDAVSPYPVCSPARAMMLTGQYPWANGVPFNVNSQTAPWGVGLRQDATCWSDVLAEAGYRLGYIGKLHLTPPTAADERYGEGRRDDGKVWDAWTPPGQRHGFAFWYSHGCCDHHLTPHYWSTDAAQDAPHRVEQWSAEHETDVALGFLRDVAAAGPGQRRPFGLVVSINPPHQPFDQVPEPFRRLYAGLSPEELLTRPNVDLDSEAGREAASIAGDYFAAVTAVDDQVGRLLAELDASGLAEDTIVIFTSDHGMQLGSHGLLYKNVPYDESVRVPFVVRWPGRIAPGTDDLLLGSADVAPTLLGLLGLADRIPAETQGSDCSGALLGRPDAPRPDTQLYFRPPLDPDAPDLRGLRSHSHKLVAEFTPGSAFDVLLFDLVGDPYELADVAAGQPDVLASMTAELKRRLAEIGDPWPGLAHLEQAR